MSIGDRIKRLRVENNLSVDDVADRIGRDRSTVYRYEKAEVEIPATVVEEIANVLGCSPAYLMGWGNVCEPLREETTLSITLSGERHLLQDILLALAKR